METKQLLECAADHLDRVGLHKGAYLAREAYVDYVTADAASLPCCALGAIRVCAGLYTTDDAYWDADRNRDAERAAFALSRFLGHQFIPRWNDAPERTKEEVVAALRGAAAIAGSP